MDRQSHDALHAPDTEDEATRIRDLVRDGWWLLLIVVLLLLLLHSV